MNRVLLLTACLTAIFTGCETGGLDSGVVDAPTAKSAIAELEIPTGTEFDVVIFPSGWVHEGPINGSPKQKGFDNVDEKLIRAELDKLDWVTASGPTHSAPEFLLIRNVEGFEEIKLSAVGSTNSSEASDSKLHCQFSFRDSDGGSYFFRSEHVDDPSILPDLFSSFLANQSDWQKMTSWESW